MQLSLPFLAYLFLWSLFPADSQQFSKNQVLVDGTQYLYIYAPSGLNMRDGPTVSFKKLTKIPYGSKVEVIVPAKERDIIVDGLVGGMAKVAFEGFTGYAFDGYMCQFRTPEKDSTTRRYIDILREDGHLIYLETVHRDYDGYYQYEETLTLHKSTWQEAFLLGKQLFGIPDKLLFPSSSKENEKIYENPEKKEISWTDELRVLCKDGLLTEIQYGYRAEGGGYGVTISREKDQKGAFKVTQLQIAD